MSDEQEIEFLEGDLAESGVSLGEPAPGDFPNISSQLDREGMDVDNELRNVDPDTLRNIGGL